MNITGLSIGLAVSIMLLLFVTNELSFDRHFANSNRIISLNTVWKEGGEIERYPINLRRAYTEIPDKVAGIEACTQIYRGHTVELTHKPNRFQGLELLYVDPEFFKVFQLIFHQGSPETALTNPNTLVITRRYANIIFGSMEAAMGKTVAIHDIDYTIDAVVEQLPSNTHFSFDILGGITSVPNLQSLGSLEFFTFYLIDAKSPVDEVRYSIEQTYSEILSSWLANWEGVSCFGETEMLTDLYLFSKADFGLGKRSDIGFVGLLSALSLFILLLAVANFMNLFLTQGETRMSEIGIRKANGAGMGDLVKQFFSEVFIVTFVAFIVGLLLAIAIAPYFSKLIGRDVALVQLGNPLFLLSALSVFILTVTLSAGYPSFYLSSLKPLDVLNRRVRFGKRRLTTTVIIFQAIVAIVLISYVLIVNRQTSYIENLPVGYHPKNVMMVESNRTTASAYESLRQELLRYPQVKQVSAATHNIGGGCSGQAISTPEDSYHSRSIDEYRVMPGLGELMEIEMVEGRFFNENDPNNLTSVVLNEAAVIMLGLHSPYVGKEVIYKQHSTIIGVTKNFCYDEPGFEVMPLVFSYSPVFHNIYIRFHDGVNRSDATDVATKAFKVFDSEFVLNPRWSEDVYDKKFYTIRTRSKIILFSSLLSILIAALGLVAIQSFATIRRTKEIGIRRVNGATKVSIVLLLMSGITKWIVAAGIIAIPISYWFSSNWLNNYAYKTPTGWLVFAVPILVQCLIAVLVTWGVSLSVLSKNPVESLKNE